MINLMDLTVEDLKDIEQLQKFRKEAEELYHTVIKNQTVPLILDNMNRYKLWDDSNNATYLALVEGTWIWQARYLHQTYDIPIDIEGIYRMMVRGYEHRKDESKRGFVNNNEDAIKYFKSYVDGLKKS